MHISCYESEVILNSVRAKYVTGQSGLLIGSTCVCNIQEGRYIHVCTCVCNIQEGMYIVVAVPRKDSMSPARANAAPVWALQLICWISM